MTQVQIIPAGRRSIQKEQLGAAIGQGLSKALNAYGMNKSLNEAMNNPQYKNGTPYERADILQRAMFGHGPEGQQFLQERMQLEGRRNFENALEKARKLANDPKASNMDILLALAETGVDGKQLQTFYQAIQQNRADKNITQEQPQGGNQQPGDGAQKPRTSRTVPQTKKGIDQSLISEPIEGIPQPRSYAGNPSQSNISEMRDTTLEPPKYGAGPTVPTFTPEQIAGARDRDQLKGQLGSPQGEEAQMLARNDQADKQNARNIVAAEAQAKIGAQTRQFQEEFRKTMTQQLKIKDPNDLAIAEQIAYQDENKNIANDILRVENMKPTFQRYETAKSQLSNYTRPSYVLENPKYRSKIKDMNVAADELLKYGIPGRNQAMKEIGKNGWSESQIQQGLNPLSAKIQSELNNLPNITRESNLPFTYGEGEHAKFQEKFGKWRNFFEKTIKPGHLDEKTNVYHPGPSLIPMYKSALEHRISPVNFTSMIGDMVKNKEIELDPYQQRELQLIVENPARVFSVQEVLFGK